MSEVLVEKVVEREKGYLYYIDKVGNACRSKMGGIKLTPEEKARRKAVRDKALKSYKAAREKARKDITNALLNVRKEPTIDNVNLLEEVRKNKDVVYKIKLSDYIKKNKKNKVD